MSEKSSDQLYYITKLTEPARRYPAPPPPLAFMLAVLVAIGMLLSSWFLIPSWRSILPEAVHAHPGVLTLITWSLLVVAGLAVALRMLLGQIRRIHTSMTIRVGREILWMMLPFALIGVTGFYILIDAGSWSLIPPFLLGLYGLFMYVVGHFTARIVRWVGLVNLLAGLAMVIALVEGAFARPGDELGRAWITLTGAGLVHVATHVLYAVSIQRARQMLRRLSQTPST